MQVPERHEVGKRGGVVLKRTAKRGRYKAPWRSEVTQVPGWEPENQDESFLRSNSELPTPNWLPDP